MLECEQQEKWLQGGQMKRIHALSREDFTMYVSYSKNHVLFRTPFNDTHDLVQLFRGLRPTPYAMNGPVDFMAAGLIQNGKPDFWHIDIPFAMTNDEATPCMINGAWIGANHGQPCLTQISLPSHGKTYEDIGSLWKDEKGTAFTLVSIINRDCIGFVSENIGESDGRYAFQTAAEGKLTYISHGVHTEEIPAGCKQELGYLSPALHFHRKDLVGIKDGKETLVVSGMECDYAEIREEYDIMNPALVAEALRAARPEDGYHSMPDLAIGSPILRQKMTYRIMPDGTVLSIFDLQKMADIDFEYCMCVMYQEKMDAYGGGIYRTIPGILPFTTPEGTFDFEMPVQLFPGPFPANKRLTPDTWKNPDWPCDRFVDVFRDKEGQDRLGFACGYLPVLDGDPNYRKEHLSFAAHVYRTRKAYPTFISGNPDSARGIAYKKYFAPLAQKTSVYTVPYEDKVYVYIDFFGGEAVTVPVHENVQLLDCSKGISYQMEAGQIRVCGERGHAVFTYDAE